VVYGGQHGTWHTNFSQFVIRGVMILHTTYVSTVSVVS